MAHSFGGFTLGLSLAYFGLKKSFNIGIPIVMVLGYEVFEYVFILNNIVVSQGFVVDSIIDISLGLFFAYSVFYFYKNRI